MMRLFLFAIAIASGLGATWLWFARPMQPLDVSASISGGPSVSDTRSAQAQVAALVARGDLSVGTRLLAEHLGWATVTFADLPAGAVLQAVQPDADQRMLGMHALRDIPADAPIAWNDLAGADATGLSMGIAPDHFAFAIVVSEATGVAGLVEPGDRIDLVRTRVMPEQAQRVFEIVASDVKVLAVDQRLERSTAETARPARTLTLELSAALIERISLAQGEGGVSVVLRPHAGVPPGLSKP